MLSRLEELYDDLNAPIDGWDDCDTAIRQMGTFDESNFTTMEQAEEYLDRLIALKIENLGYWKTYCLKKLACRIEARNVQNRFVEKNGVDALRRIERGDYSE